MFAEGKFQGLSEWWNRSCLQTNNIQTPSFSDRPPRRPLAKAALAGGAAVRSPAMPRLFLIRHGQASFQALTADEYDVLSDLGRRQAEALGRHLATRRRTFQQVWAGPLRRQRRTAELMIEAAGLSGHELPEVQEHAGLTEYDAFGILHRVLEAPDRLAADLQDRLRLDDGRPRDRATFTAAIKTLMLRWAREELDLDGETPIEPYAAFEARVLAALDDIVRGLGRGEEAAVVTSGGPIGVALRRALGVDVDRTIELAWTVQNASFHELLARPGALGLVRFNNVAHLEPEELVTSQ